MRPGAMRKVTYPSMVEIANWNKYCEEQNNKSAISGTGWTLVTCFLRCIRTNLGDGIR